MTLTPDLSDLRSAADITLEQLSSAAGEQFEQQLSELQNLLLSLYRFAVLAVRKETNIEHAADIWRETLALIDSAANQAQPIAERHPGSHPALSHILQIRNAATDMLALYE